MGAETYLSELSFSHMNCRGHSGTIAASIPADEAELLSPRGHRHSFSHTLLRWNSHRVMGRGQRPHLLRRGWQGHMVEECVRWDIWLQPS